MTLSGLSNLQLGSCSELLVWYKLKRFGENVIRVGQTYPYDLLVMRDNPIKIQVKSTHKPDGYSYRFTLSHKLANDKYEKTAYDVLALVALDLEKVVFSPHIDQYSFRMKERDFTDELSSWNAALDNLDKV